MKFLEAQRLAASHAEDGTTESKMMPPHANKMMPPHANKSEPSSPATLSSPPIEVMSEEIHALAQSLGVDVTQVVGTGKDGRVLMRDIRAAAIKHS